MNSVTAALCSDVVNTFKEIQSALNLHDFGTEKNYQYKLEHLVNKSYF